MMGFNIIDELRDQILFKGFTDTSAMEKIQWIAVYPLSLLMLLIIIVTFFTIQISDTLKTKIQRK